MVWIMEPGQLSLSHSTILRDSRAQKHPRPCPPVCVCLLSTTADCTYIHSCWTTWADQLSGYGNHFTK